MYLTNSEGGIFDLRKVGGRRIENLSESIFASAVVGRWVITKELGCRRGFIGEKNRNQHQKCCIPQLLRSAGRCKSGQNERIYTVGNPESAVLN